MTQYGMIPSLGTINYATSNGYQKSFSEKTGHMIDTEVRRIITDQYSACKDLLESKRPEIER